MRLLKEIPLCRSNVPSAVGVQNVLFLSQLLRFASKSDLESRKAGAKP